MTRGTRWTVAVAVAGCAAVGVADRMVVAAQAAQVGQVAAQIIPPDQEDEFAKGAVTAKTPGLVMPKALKQTSPKYTPTALRARIEGKVKVEAIIGVDGRVEKSRVKEPLDTELDAQALMALNEWVFEAGRLNDRPVRVLIAVEMAFTYR